METVKFTDVEEFLEELARESGNIDRRIVRVTGRTIPSKVSPILYSLQVTATATVIAHSTRRASVGKQLLRLDESCGQLFFMDGKVADHHSEETYNRGKNLEKVLELKLKDLGFDVRSGIIDPEGGP